MNLELISYESGNLTSADYIDVYWSVTSVGGGLSNYILIKPDSNIEHTFIGTDNTEDACLDADWKLKSFTKDLTITNNNKLRLKIVLNSTATSRQLKIKKVEVTGF